MTKASVISLEIRMAVPTVLVGAHDYYMLLSAQLTSSYTCRQAWSWLAEFGIYTKIILGILKYCDGRPV